MPSKKSLKGLSHEQRVFFVGCGLLDTLESWKEHLRSDELVKSAGWFLVCLGESYEKGSIQKARSIKKIEGRSDDVTSSLGVALCTYGDQIMDWSTGLLLTERKATREAKKSKAPKSISARRK